MRPRLGCAIYTRKSTEEGLEQGFNSLHAQREACEAYVLSQSGEGWQALADVYDDGGYSGGSMERPGLQQLLADIERGQIDVVVVYKVDRLTRSLADFAKIVEIFDGQGVSFVSVTQAFNTTTSMGRLTLNVLLSFAQFEREVTGERIRDKIAASKAKGLRMGGRPPLGYDILDLRPVVKRAEADQVCQIFKRYLEVESVTALAADLEATGVRSKRWINRGGVEVGGTIMSRGALHHLLSNPVYRGTNRHKKVLHAAAHEAIIDESTWNAVQAKLAQAASAGPGRTRLHQTAMLKGLLSDDRGHPMGVVHTARGVKRYRYYLSRPARARAGEPTGSLARIAVGVLDAYVTGIVLPRLSPAWRPGETDEARVRSAVRSVTVSATEVRLVVGREALSAREIGVGLGSEELDLRLPIILKHREGAVLIAPQDGVVTASARHDKTLLRAVVLARAWAKELAHGQFESIKALALRYGLCPAHTMKLAPLGYLAPDIVAMILEGAQPQTLSLKSLTAQPLPMDWSEQRALVQAISSGRI